MEPVRNLLLAAIALCGLAIVILSFLTWVQFETRIGGVLDGVPPVIVETSGLETSVWRDDESIGERVTAQHGIGWCTCEVEFGDGYITAVLGLVLVSSAAAVALKEQSIGLLTGFIAAFATIFVAGFNAFAEWSALIAITDAGTTSVADGEVQFALYAILGVAALSAVLTTGAWVADRADDIDEEYDDEDESPEGTEAWA